MRGHFGAHTNGHRCKMDLLIVAVQECPDRRPSHVPAPSHHTFSKPQPCTLPGLQAGEDTVVAAAIHQDLYKDPQRFQGKNDFHCNIIYVESHIC